jgi:lambda repressor-like predicted transcriptional regulator
VADRRKRPARRRHLQPAAVVAMRRAYQAGATIRALAAEHGLAEETIRDTLTGRAWPDAGGPIAERLRGVTSEVAAQKLTRADVRAIRAEFAGPRYVGQSRAACERYGISRAMLGNILRGDAWPEPTDPA